MTKYDTGMSHKAVVNALKHVEDQFCYKIPNSGLIIWNFLNK